MQTTIAFSIVALFAAVHIWGGRLKFLAVTPRSVWLSAAGGVSVAYVFLHLLPDLAEHQEAIGRGVEGIGLGPSLESHAYIIALIGLTAFYGIERFARSQRDEDGAQASSIALTVFWTHLGAFGLYNVLIGYLLTHREEADLRGLLMYAVAMSLHFVVNDQGLRQQHGHLYQHYGRWLLAVAPALGFALGLFTAVSSVLLSSLFAFLGGGVILNVLKEELPEDRESRFSAFAAGAVVYSTLLLLSD